MRRHWRRWRVPIVVFGGLLVLLWLALAGRTFIQVKEDIETGLDQLRSLRSEASAVGLVQGEGRERLLAAEAAFAEADRGLGSLLVAPFRALPVIGRHVRTADALTSTAVSSARTAVDALDEVQVALDGVTDGPTRVDAALTVARVADAAARSLGQADLGPDSALITEVADAREEVRLQLEDARVALRSLARSAAQTADLLAGPRRYLLLAGNNAEMRAGAGMPLSVGLLEFRDGELDVPGGMSSVGALPTPAPGLVVDPDLARIWGAFDPAQTWTSASLTPRFDAAAPLLADMWASIGRPPVDGVILIDPVGLQAVLTATGPVQTATETVSADTVVENLLHVQYVEDPDLETRRERLGEIAEAAVGALAEGVDPVELATGLLEVARGRHLLAWAASADDAELWSGVGAVGDISRDSLLVSVVNRGANKLDRFLPVSAILDADQGDAGTDVVLRLRVDNRTPPGMPRAVTGDPGTFGAPVGTYAGIVTVHLPGAASVVDAGLFVPVGSDGPSQAFVLPLRLLAGEGVDLVISFRLPAGQGLVVLPSARVPGVQWQIREEEEQVDAFLDDRSRRVLPVAS